MAQEQYGAIVVRALRRLSHRDASCRQGLQGAGR